ncbi:substrate-binding periplasmic protein [Pseudoalteromonas sp. T1lg24]|uniref:substrate-binding periplasmic protein n=1 Tax=Pseudoalteromonas sp. T1lg24 TaxID=2077099 RepID=UPI000CF6E437|nr:transporter substrate-binding domain-containing protein [Pseudoalteromonas sp. T1lg24]
MQKALWSLLLLVVCCQCYSAQTPPVECKTPLSLSITNDWYPYVKFSKFDSTTGVDVELLKKVLEQMGCELTVIRFPERRTLFELTIGNFDIGLGASKTPERERDFYFSKTYRLERNRFAYRQNDHSVKQSKSFKSIIKQRKLIGVNLAGWYGDELERAKQAYNGFVFSETTIKRLEMLVKNRVDIVIDDDVVLCSEISRQNHPQVVIHPLLLSQASIHFIFNKQSVSPTFMARFDTALTKVLANGELEALFSHYVSPSCAEQLI